MLLRREIAVGKGYVNEALNLLCEIDAVINRWTVLYTNYDLATGRLHRTPHQIGKKHNLIRWADREATSEEMESLQRSEKECLYKRPEHIAQDNITPVHFEEIQTMARVGSFKL